MSQEAEERDQNFWYQLKLNAASALVVAAGGAILWISYKVPLQLDAILDNQKEQAEDITNMKADLKMHDRRITQLEIRP